MDSVVVPVFGVVMACYMMWWGVGGVRKVPSAWRGDRRPFERTIPGAYLEMNERNEIAYAIAGVLWLIPLAVVSFFAVGAHVLNRPDLGFLGVWVVAFLVLGMAGGTVFAVLGMTINAVNRPRLLVPPRWRDKPGWVQHRASARRRRREQRQRGETAVVQEEPKPQFEGAQVWTAATVAQFKRQWAGRYEVLDDDLELAPGVMVWGLKPTADGAASASVISTADGTYLTVADVMFELPDESGAAEQLAWMLDALAMGRVEVRVEGRQRTCRIWSADGTALTEHAPVPLLLRRRKPRVITFSPAAS